MSQPPSGCVQIIRGAMPAGGLTGLIADALEETARSLAGDVEATEELAARLPATPGITDAVTKLKRRAELLGIAHAYFQEMALRPETPVDVEDFALRPIGPSCTVTKP